MHERNCFITLTYDEENLPNDRSVDVKHWQKFAKKLRKEMGPFRFLHCGEYGDLTHRAHYHACLFGIDFGEDRVELAKDGDHTKWVSPTLQKIWGKGICQIGSLTYDSAAYVARYVLKKYTGKNAAEHYREMEVDEETGEILDEWTVRPEYATMSRRPGLGEKWFKKFHEDVYPDDFVIMKGQKFRPPKYYDQLMERRDQKNKTRKMIEIKKRRRIESKKQNKKDKRTPELKGWIKNRIQKSKLTLKKETL